MRGLMFVGVLAMSACGGSSTGPTATPAPVVQVVAAAPVVIQKANMILGNATIDCVRGLCTSFVATLSNVGLGCATHVAVLVEWIGGDGKQLPNTGDMSLGAAGSSLGSKFFRPGDVLIVGNTASFADVRSVNTRYISLATWDNVACQ